MKQTILTSAVCAMILVAGCDKKDPAPSPDASQAPATTTTMAVTQEAALPQAATAAQAPQTTLTDEALRKFVMVSIVMTGLNQQAKQAVQQAEQRGDQQAIQQIGEEMMQRMDIVIQNSGLTPQQLNKFGAMIESDPELMARAKALAEEIAAERRQDLNLPVTGTE